MAKQMKCQECGTGFEDLHSAADHESATGHTVPALWDKNPSRPSYSDEPQQMTDVLGPRPSGSIFRDRRKPRGNGTQGEPGLTSL